MTERTTEILFAEERRADIVRWVNEKKKVLVPELIEHYKVSPATIRGDLRELEASGLIRRTHGGAIPGDAAKAGYEPEAAAKNVSHLAQKRAIAEAAAELIEDGDIVILDTGTTTFELAKLLKDRNNVTVIVNDLEMALYLEQFEGVQVIVVGGTLRKKFHCTVGPFATNLLAELNVDKVFLGTNAFSAQKGCTTPDINQAEIKKIMVRIATQVIVLCDSSKIGHKSFVPFAGTSDIDLLITDDRISPGQLEALTDLGLDVQLAGASL